MEPPSLSEACRRCGSPLGRFAPGRVCARCLLESGLSDSATGDATGGTGGADPGGLGRFGRYELLEEIAHGGMGVVYRARDTALNRDVALKMILAGQFARQHEVQRFRAEAEAAARLDHPNIVPIFEVGEQDGRPFYSMKFMEGGTLTAHLAGRASPLGQREAATLLLKVARAVHHAHMRAILHRDIKPGNVLLDARGEPQVSDFGLAKCLDGAGGITASGAMLGSPSYMSPEQAAGHSDRLTTASDTYSLGALFYHLLTGRPPFEGPSPLATMEKVLHQEPRRPREVRPGLDPDLETICLKCLEKEPQHRYGSAGALADDVQRWLQGEPIKARGVTWDIRLRKWVLRNPKVAGLALLLVASTVLGLAGVVSQWLRAETLAREEALLRLRAEEGERAASRHLYAANMLLAHQALQDLNLGRAYELLRGPTSIPGGDDLRGWEWHYLNAQCQSDELRTVGTHDDPFACVRFSPESGMLVSADEKGTVRFWNPGDGQLLREVRIPAVQLRGLEFSPDGAWVGLAVDHRFELRSARTWEVVHRLATEDPALSVGFSSDSAEAVLASRREIVHWNIADARERLRYRASVSGRYMPGRVAFSPDGQVAAATLSSSRIGRRNLRDGMWLREIPGHSRSTTDLAWSPDGRRLASGGMDGVVRLWDGASGLEVTNHGVHRGWITSIAFSPDGRLLASAGADQRLVLWEVEAWREFANLKGSRSALLSVSFSPDGQTLATGGQDGAIRLWRSTPPTALARSRALPGLHLDPVLSADGATVAFVSRETPDARLSLWNGSTLEEQASFELPEADVTTFAVGPAAREAALGAADGQVQVATVPPGRCRAEWQPLGRHEGGVMQVSYSRDGRFLLTAGKDDQVRLWDARSRTVSMVLEDEIGSYVRPCAISDDASRLSVITRDNHIRIYGTASRERIALLPARTPYWDDPAFSPDNRYFAASSRDGWLHVWELGGPRKVASLRGQLLHIHWITFSPDGRRLAIGSGEGTVKLWETTSYQEVATLRTGGEIRPVLGVLFSDDGNALTAVKKNAAFHWSALGAP